MSTVIASESCTALLGGGDLEPAQLFDDGRHLPGADSLHVHLRHGEEYGPLAANAPVQSLWIEGPPVLIAVAPSLWDPQVDLANTSAERLRLKTIGVALTIGTLRDSGQVHEDCEGGSHGIWAMLHRQINKVADRGSIVLVGQRRFLGGVEVPPRKPR